MPEALQLDSLQQIAEGGPDLFTLRNHDMLFLFFLNRSFSILEGFHAQGDAAILDSGDLDLDLLTDFEDVRWGLDSLLADLGNVKETCHTVSDVDECTVVLEGLDRPSVTVPALTSAR